MSSPQPFLTETENLYQPGAPQVWQVLHGIRTEQFAHMQAYSEAYLNDNAAALANYRWIKDALQQWSRIYEYPFCYHHLRRAVQPGAAVLDAGCGVTFFPFLLSRDYALTCVDVDDYAETYRSIAQVQHTALRFVQADLRAIPLDGQSFDAVYCISVLEHTQGYEQIVAEFWRLLKPGGALLVTFDIALDGNREGLSPGQAASFVGHLAGRFDTAYDAEQLLAQLAAPEIYSTGYVYRWNEALLPWPPSSLRLRLRNLLRKPKYLRDRIQMTFCNLALRKPFPAEHTE